MPANPSRTIESTRYVPIGINCSVAHYLRDSGRRRTAFPFDWMIISSSIAIEIVLSRFSNYLSKKDLHFLEPTPRSLYNEHGSSLIIENDMVTPTVSERHSILLPHDFSVTPEDDFRAVREKYRRRQRRLTQLLEEEAPLCFVYTLEPITEWQASQYSAAGLQPPNDTVEEIESRFEALKKLYPKVDLVSLNRLKRSLTTP